MNTEVKETWKYVTYPTVKEHMYSVSNFGNIRNNFTRKTLSPWKNNQNGYLYIYH